MDENISPNEGFDVMFYLQAKADALNAVHYEGKTNWDASSVMNAFKAAGIECVGKELTGKSVGDQVKIVPMDGDKKKVYTIMNIEAAF